MELTDVLARTFDHTTRIVAGVDPGRLDRPTPCPEWDTRTLLVHTFGVVANMGRAARGAALEDSKAYPLGPDLPAQFRGEADRTLAAWQACGPDGVVDFGAGPMPVTAGLGINILDTAAHSWDIARATHQDGTFPDPLAEVLCTVVVSALPDGLRPGRFDPPVALGDDADATDRFAALLGRRP